MRTKEELKGVELLGNQNTKYEYNHPVKEMLETFVNKHPDNDYVVDFKIPEFTSLCPKTGQPDFATIRITYIPDELLVESKSLKLYMFSYRNHGDFHEDCTNKIMKDLSSVLQPKWLRVISDFTPRGGISISTIAEYKTDYDAPEEVRRLPENIHLRH